MSQAKLCVFYLAVFLLCCACLLVLHTSDGIISEHDNRRTEPCNITPTWDLPILDLPTLDLPEDTERRELVKPNSLPAWLTPAKHNASSCIYNDRRLNNEIASMYCMFPARDAHRQTSYEITQPAGTGWAVISQAALYQGRLWVNGGLSASSHTQIAGLDFGVLPFYSFHMDGQEAGLWRPSWIKCKHHVSAAVYARPDLGAIYTNFWHTVATYLSPIFWALLDNERLLFTLDQPPNIHLISPLMPEQNYKDILVSDVYPDPDRIREHNVAKGTMANLFSRIWFLDTQDVRQEDAAVCIDRLYVRTNGDWNPETFTKELCCQHGRTLYDSQWAWRQYMLIRFGASEEVMNTPWDAWKNTRTINFMWISRRLARHKHITNEEELYDQSLLHMRRRGLRVEAQMASFDTISNAEQAMLVASSHFIVANRGAAITNMVYARPGLGFLYLGSHNFEAVTGQKELWFKTFFYDPSTMPANANWENYSIPSLEYMQQFRGAFDSVFFDV